MTDTDTTLADHPLRAGIEAIRVWLTARGISANRLAIQNGIDPSLLSKLMRGEIKRMSMDMASKIERATDGDVPLTVWRTAEKEEKDA